MVARVVVLASGEGTLLQALLDAAGPDLGADAGTDATADAPAGVVAVVAVVTDRPAVRALERAALAGVPTAVVRLSDHPHRDAWDAALTAAVAAHRPDLVVCAGFNRLLGPRFLDAFAGRVLNSHPALLPSFPGLHAARDALAHGVKVTGATLFLVDAGTDTGPIVAQVAVPVLDGDTEDVLHERIKQAERVMLPEQVARLARSGFGVEGREVRIG